MKSFQLFIGANNQTKKLEIKKMQKELDQHCQGYTVSQAIGVWQGIHEKSAIIEITTDKNIIPIIKKLKKILKQDAIAYKITNPLIFY